MVYNVRSEGGYVKQGLNVYPLSDRSSTGFVFRVLSLLFYVRFSKKTRKISAGCYNIKELRWPDAIQKQN